jgi:hypothetical protein
MTLVTRSIPGLFGGVSQQIPAMRHPTQCSEQDNGLATLVDGLYKRPGSKHLAVLPLTGPGGQNVSGSFGAASAHVIEHGGSLYQLVLVNGNMVLYSIATGAAQTVSFPAGFAYLNTADPENDFRCVTVADYTFIVNLSKTVAMKSTTAAANPTGVAYVNVKTAVPNADYSVTIDATTTTVNAGGTPTSGSIATALRNALATAHPTFTFYVVPGTNIVKVSKPAATFVCTASDTWGNQAIQAIHNGVDTFSQLPPRFEPGYTMTIHGSADSPDDAYFVKWTGDRWQETVKPGLTTTLDETTMPHQLRPDGAGGWVFEAITWANRLVGDDETNPVPSFVGTKMRGAFFFRNRLGFLAADTLVLSRAGSYFNFFASTATQVLDTDPIDLGATAEQVETLDWAVPYNQTLVVWASSKQQFVLTAGDVLSPNTARLQPSTTFESYNGVRPAPLGNRILFASTVGSNTQVNLYRVSEDTVTNTAEDVSEHVPSYVPAQPRQLIASTTLKMAVVVPRGASKELYLLKYEVDTRDQLTQRAWQKVIFNTTDTVRIICAHWASRKLYLLKHVITADDPVAGGRFVLESIDFEEKAEDANVGFGLRLDNRTLATPASFDGTNTLIDVPGMHPHAELVMLSCAAGAEPVLLTVVGAVTDTVNLRTRVTVAGNHMADTVWAGRKFNFRYVFTEVFMRDGESLPILEASVKLVRMVVRYVTTGWFKAKVTPLLRSTYEYPFSGRTVGMPGQGVQQLAVSTGTFAIPVNAKASNCEVVIETDSYLPCKFPFAEWVGDVTMKARR